MAAEKPNQEALDRARAYFDECSKTHDVFVAEVEKRHKIYRAILEPGSPAADWTSKAHPPYIMHIVKTTLAALVDDKLRGKVEPNASMATFIDHDAALRARQGARAHQILSDYQTKKDKFTHLQRAFILQDAIAGYSVIKTRWAREEKVRRVMEPVDVEIVPGFFMPQMQETEKSIVTYDGPTSEVRDVRDWLYPGNSVSLPKCPYIIDRVWLTPDEVEEGFKDGGPFGPERGGWSLKDVAEVIAHSKDSSREDLPYREGDLFNIDRTRGLVEIWEVWDRERQEVTTVANRVALLSHRKKFPFNHGEYPFVVMSTDPELFRIPGISQVEKIAHLQTLLWDITNQSLDNLRLINNAIFMIRPDVEDPEAYDFYPGARWFVDDPKQVVPWTPNPIPAEISINREALIKGDMQNLAGGMPFSSGTDSQFVDQKTATGASLVSNIAQKGMDLAKQQCYRAYEEVLQQRLELNQQFIRVPMIVPILGLDGEQIEEEIMPELLAGDYKYTITPMPDAMVRQEDQAAAMAVLQQIAAVYPIAAMAAQNGSATPINLDAYIEDLLLAHGKEDLARYFARKSPVALPSGGGGGGGGGPATPGQAPLGVTAPQSIDPAVSPSSGISLSPATAMQRAQALDRS